MKITGHTKITGLFGYPVEHTLSPAMHNAAFEYLGLDYCYLPFLVRPEEIDIAVMSIKVLNLAGVNVTVPHKESVMKYIDEIDSEALFIGAVNTILNRDGRLTGYNTDGRGFMRSLEENNVSLRNKKVLIVGTGGAARAISYYICQDADSLTLFDIDRKKSEKLASDLSKIKANIAVKDDLRNIESFNIIINATPLGLKIDDPLPFDISYLTSEHTVCDLIYRKTRLLSNAQERGCLTIDGSGMLLYQGVLAFEIWTGVYPPVDIMRKALQNASK